MNDIVYKIMRVWNISCGEINIGSTFITVFKGEYTSSDIKYINLNFNNRKASIVLEKDKCCPRYLSHEFKRLFKEIGYTLEILNTEI